MRELAVMYLVLQLFGARAELFRFPVLHAWSVDMFGFCATNCGTTQMGYIGLAPSGYDF